MKNKQIALLQARLRVLEGQKTDLERDLEESQNEARLCADECENWEKTCNYIIEERDEAQAELKQANERLGHAIAAAAHLIDVTGY